MIDSREPKNGDFASYVESLVNAPKAQQLPDAPATGWGHGRDGGATRPDATRLDGGATRRDAGGARPNAGATRPDAGAGPLSGESLEARLKRLREALPHAPGKEPDLASLAGGVGSVLRPVAPLISFFGLASIVLSFTGDPPFFADPAFGILLIAIGAILKRLARKPG